MTKTFIRLRIEKYEEYIRQMISNIQNQVLWNSSAKNPFKEMFDYLRTFNSDQDKMIKNYLATRKKPTSI